MLMFHRYTDTAMGGALMREAHPTAALAQLDGVVVTPCQVTHIAY